MRRTEFTKSSGIAHIGDFGGLEVKGVFPALTIVRNSLLPSFAYYLMPEFLS